MGTESVTRFSAPLRLVRRGFHAVGMRGQAVRDPLAAGRPLSYGPSIARQQVECFFDRGELTHDP